MRELEEFKRIMFGNIQNINHMHKMRNQCFQQIGMYDGAMSEECKEKNRQEYEFWDSLIKEYDSVNQG